MKELTTYVHLLLQLLLFITFLLFFGLPAVEKFRERKVVVVESRRAGKGIPAPSITITLKEGWKDFHEGVDGSQVEASCRDPKERVESCIARNTYSKTQVLRDVLLGFDSRQSFIGK